MTNTNNTPVTMNHHDRSHGDVFEFFQRGGSYVRVKKDTPQWSAGCYQICQAAGYQSGVGYVWVYPTPLSEKEVKRRVAQNKGRRPRARK